MKRFIVLLGLLILTACGSAEVESTLRLPTLPANFIDEAVEVAPAQQGELVEESGCLYFNANDAGSYLVVWPAGSTRSAEGEVLNRAEEVIGQVGEPIILGGHAADTEDEVAFYEQEVPELPVPGCPGPYWITRDLIPEG